MALGSIFDRFKEAAGGALGNLTEVATTAAESAGLGDLVQQATDALGGATEGLGDVAQQATEGLGDVAQQATEGLGDVAQQATDAATGLTEGLTGGK